MSPVFLLKVTVVSASTSLPDVYGHSSSWNMMMFALPSTWLYSCILQATVPNTGATRIDGAPPPGHSAFCQTAKALDAAVLAVSRSTFFDASRCIEYDTQNCGHQMGVPAGHDVMGSSGQSFPHDIVRQNANAACDAPSAAAPSKTVRR